MNRGTYPSTALSAPLDHNDFYIRQPGCGETQLRRHTRAVADTTEYVARATAEIHRILDEQHAVVQPEIVSRIAEGSFASSRDNIDPHHTTTALRELSAAGHIIWDRAPARGGRQDIVTIQPTDQHRRTTKIGIAAARKRLLFARYNGWAGGTVRHPQGLIGPAGEAAVRAAILSSGALQPAVPGAGEVTQLLGTHLPGALDSAGFMVPFTGGVPSTPVTLLIEVKNIRSWIYPTSIELYQVLHKGSVLQLAHPDQRIMPILICRKAHITTFWMAKQLGFVVIDTDRQPVGDVDEDDLAEVRNELHFQDLVRGAPLSIRVRDRLQKSLPPRCVEIAEQWSSTCNDADFTDAFNALRYTTQQSARAVLVNDLRDAARSSGKRGGW